MGPPTAAFELLERNDPSALPHRDHLRNATYDVKPVWRKRDNPVNFAVDNGESTPERLLRGLACAPSAA
jgi:hypothetical protein